MHSLISAKIFGQVHALIPLKLLTQLIFVTQITVITVVTVQEVEDNMSSYKTIPMSTEEIQELFLNQGTHYKIDLASSKLQGEAFITYIANMQMDCSLPLDVEVSSEEGTTLGADYVWDNLFGGKLK